MTARVLVIALGGTIAMTHSSTGGISPTLNADDLLSVVPNLREIANIEALSPFQLPGASLTIEHIRRIAKLITDAKIRGFTGVVVVQGTDTIEETAFVLDRLVSPDIAVVVTGAMRGPEAPGADGAANLTAAISVAASVAARRLGTLVVLNDTVHAAALVRKAHTGLPSTFTSDPYGPLGYYIEGQFLVVMSTVLAERLPQSAEGLPAPVALLQIGLGDDGRLLPALPALGFKGLVIAAMGAGHVPQSFVTPLEELAKQMPVVLCSRVANGPVFERTYGFPGSERDLRSRGLLGGGSLGPLKSRLLLQLALEADFSSDRIKSLFN